MSWENVEAMSRENVEKVRRGIESFNRRNFDATLELWHPEVEVYEEPELPDAHVWRGIDGARAYWDESFTRWREMRIEPREFIDLEDAVVVVGTQTGTRLPCIDGSGESPHARHIRARIQL